MNDEEKRIQEVVDMLKEEPLKDDHRIYFNKIDAIKEEKGEAIEELNESFVRFARLLQNMVMDDKDATWYFMFRDHTNGFMIYLKEKLDDYINMSDEEREELSLKEPAA